MGESGAVIKSRKGFIEVEGRTGICCRWKEKGQPLEPLSHQHQEEEARQEKETSEVEVRLAEFFDNRADTISEAEASLVSPTDSRAKTIWKVLVRDHFVSIRILPNVNSIKLNRDAKQGSGCKAGDKCLFPHYKVEEQPSKKPKKIKTEKATTKVLQ